MSGGTSPQQRGPFMVVGLLSVAASLVLFLLLMRALLLVSPAGFIIFFFLLITMRVHEHHYNCSLFIFDFMVIVNKDIGLISRIASLSHILEPVFVFF